MEEERYYNGDSSIDEEVLDCDIYTYKVTHDDEEELKDEDVENKFILKCLNCGFVYNSAEKPKDYKDKELNIYDYILSSDDSKFRCPHCGKITYFECITEEEYKEIMEKKKKQQEEKEKRQKKQKEIRLERFIKVNMANFNDDLKRITEELEFELFSGSISENRFNHIFRFATYNLYKKYERLFAIKGIKDKLSLDDFNDVTREMSNDALKRYRQQERRVEKIDDLEEDINQDAIYLDIMRRDIEDREILPEDASDEQAQEYRLYYKQKDYEKRVHNLEKEKEYELENERRKSRELQLKNKKVIDEYVRTITKSGNK